jgi:hypothetical protein
MIDDFYAKTNLQILDSGELSTLHDFQFFRAKYPACILSVRVELAVRSDGYLLLVGNEYDRAEFTFVHIRTSLRGRRKHCTTAKAAEVDEPNSIPHSEQ